MKPSYLSPDDRAAFLEQLEKANNNVKPGSTPKDNLEILDAVEAMLDLLAGIRRGEPLQTNQQLEKDHE